ncbi:MAG: hypothetical protein ABEK01_01225 [Candidatus Nanohaloarchaea archaeon]
MAGVFTVGFAVSLACVSGVLLAYLRDRRFSPVSLVLLATGLMLPHLPDLSRAMGGPTGLMVRNLSMATAAVAVGTGSLLLWLELTGDRTSSEDT